MAGRSNPASFDMKHELHIHPLASELVVEKPMACTSHEPLPRNRFHRKTA
jgi:hypothetical protein